MLWDIIRDFIVQNITGGYNSNGVGYAGHLGLVTSYENGNYDDLWQIGTDEIWYKVGSYNANVPQDLYISMGDWLATTLTIISMCLLFAFAIWLIRWVFKAVSSAFLLRR